MPKQVTVAAGNRYCKARLEAAKYNPELLCRATAANYLPGVTEDSLKKYELDINRPPNIVVALMADAYNQPELRSWYCANECPLGKDRVEELDGSPIEAASIRLHNAADQMDEVISDIFEVVDDGIITDDEWPRLQKDKRKLQRLRKTIEETLIAIEKQEKKQK